MKILYDYAAFLGQARGGVSRIMCEVIKRELARDDVEGRVFAGVHRNYELHQLAQQFPGKIKEIFLPERVVKQRIFRPVNHALFRPFARYFNPDICHYTFTLVPPVPRKTKKIFTVHDLLGEIYLPDNDPQVRERKIALSQADGIICISENTRKDLLRFYDVQEKPIIVAYHGNSLRHSPVTPPDITRPYILYVGTRGARYKNSEMVFDTFARSEALRDHALVCFGGKPFSGEELQRLEKLRIADRVLHRKGGDPELAGYYQQATALVYPSLYEGFGLPPIEAMGLGCPVLASSGPPMPEIIGDAALFFDPESPEQLLNAFDKLVLEKGVRESLIAKGKEREQFFSWERTSDQIHQFYQTVLGR